MICLLQQQLTAKPSIEKRQKQNCIPNKMCRNSNPIEMTFKKKRPVTKFEVKKS